MSDAATTPVVNNDYAYASKSRNCLQKIVTHQGIPKKPVRVIYYHHSSM